MRRIWRTLQRSSRVHCHGGAWPDSYVRAVLESIPFTDSLHLRQHLGFSFHLSVLLWSGYRLSLTERLRKCLIMEPGGVKEMFHVYLFHRNLWAAVWFARTFSWLPIGIGVVISPSSVAFFGSFVPLLNDSVSLDGPRARQSC